METLLHNIVFRTTKQYPFQWISAVRMVIWNTCVYVAILNASDFSLAVVHSQDCITNREKVGKEPNLQYGTFQQFYGFVILFGRRLEASLHSKASLHLNWMAGTAIVRLQLARIWVILTLATQDARSSPNTHSFKIFLVSKRKIQQWRSQLSTMQYLSKQYNTIGCVSCQRYKLSFVVGCERSTLSPSPSYNTLKRQEISKGLEKVQGARVLCYCCLLCHATLSTPK